MHQQSIELKLDLRPRIYRLLMQALHPEITTSIASSEPITVHIDMTHAAQHGSIHELHKQLRIYEATHSLPQLTEQDFQELKSSIAPLPQGESAHQSVSMTEGMQPGIMLMCAKSIQPVSSSPQQADTLPTTNQEDRLPPITEGLVFPRDASMIEYLGENLGRCIRVLGEAETPWEERERIFEDLRRHARKHGTSDRVLLETIKAWRPICAAGKNLIERVWTSIEASAAAEKSSQDQQLKTGTHLKARYWIYGPKASGKSILAQRIAGHGAICITARHSSHVAMLKVLSENPSIIIDEFQDQVEVKDALLAAISTVSITQATAASKNTRKFDFSNLETVVVISEKGPNDQVIANRFHIIELKAPGILSQKAEA